MIMHNGECGHNGGGCGQNSVHIHVVSQQCNLFNLSLMFVLHTIMDACFKKGLALLLARASWKLIMRYSVPITVKYILGKEGGAVFLIKIYLAKWKYAELLMKYISPGITPSVCLSWLFPPPPPSPALPTLVCCCYLVQGTKLWIIMEHLGGGSALDLVRISFYTGTLPKGNIKYPIQSLSKINPFPPFLFCLLLSTSR